MNVLVLSRCGRPGASSRMRFYQYLPYLEAIGIRCTLAPLFSDIYVQNLQESSKNWIEVFHAYAGRIRALLISRPFDLLWIEKELPPWMPAGFESALLPNSIPYVLNYDDAVFHYYDQHRNPVVRKLLANKHSVLMRGAALVVTGNGYLAEYAR